MGPTWGIHTVGGSQGMMYVVCKGYKREEKQQRGTGDETREFHRENTSGGEMGR